MNKEDTIADLLYPEQDLTPNYTNNIYLYKEITQAVAMNFNIKLETLKTKIDAGEYGINPINFNINVHINCEGGDLFSSFAITDYLQRMKEYGIGIITYVEGVAASGATLISLMGDIRCMTKNSFILIHQLSSGAYDKYNKLQEEMQNNKAIMDKLIEFYQAKTKISKKELLEILNKDIYLDSKKCLKLGIIDKVL